MLAEFLCIVAVYACAVVYAHWVARHRAGAPSRHYVLVAGNHEAQIEWYMRAMQMYSRRSGTDVRITVIPDHSVDGTEAIVKKFARSVSGIEWQDKTRDVGESSGTEGMLAKPGAVKAEAGFDTGSVVWVELSRVDDLKRLPI